MRTRKSDFEERKDIILGIVVNAYIKTVNPVSSAFIVQEYPLDLSSATIRNILAELERDGFLTHPHTSAGRVPTQEGYRYYVDHLMLEIQLLEEEKRRIKEEYRRKVRNLENILERTSQVISDVTQCTGIVSMDGYPDRIFCRGTSYVVNYPDGQDLRQIRDILYAIEEKEHLLHIINQDLDQKIRVYIGHELALSRVEGCSLAVSRYEIDKNHTGRIAVLGPTCMDYPRVVSTLEYLSGAIKDLSGTI